jgi:hypothetical protein
MASSSWPSGLGFNPTTFSPGITIVGEIIDVNRGGKESVVRGAQLRTATLTFDVRDGDPTYQRLLTIMEILTGMDGTIQLPWWGYAAQIGNGTGSPTVSALVNPGTSQVPTTGWGGTDPRLGQGAMVQLGNPPFVYRVITDASGAAPTLTVRPRVRQPIAAGSAVIYKPDPANGVWLVNTMRLARSTDQYGTFTDAMHGEGLTLEFVDALRDAY